MPLRLSKPNEIPDRGSLCIYGPGGVGKTTMLGTMKGNGLVVEVRTSEDGAYVLSDKADKVDVFYISKWDEIDDVIKELQSDNKKPKERRNWDWVGIDTVTGMQGLAKTKVIRERDLKAPVHKITQPEYGQMSALIDGLVMKVKALDMWSIWTAQERRHGGGEDDPGPVTIGPDILPSALRALWPPMMLGGRLFVQTGDSGELERGLRIGVNELYWAKCRALPGKKPPAVIRNPNLSRILDYLLGDGKPLRSLQTEMEI